MGLRSAVFIKENKMGTRDVTEACLACVNPGFHPQHTSLKEKTEKEDDGEVWHTVEKRPTDSNRASLLPVHPTRPSNPHFMLHKEKAI